MRLSTTLRALAAGIVICVVALWIFAGMFSGYYSYESSDRGMADFELASKGRDLKFVEARFEQYKRWKGDSHLQLFRTTKRNWLALSDILPNPRWSYPYIEPSPKPKRDWEQNMKLQELSR